MSFRPSHDEIMALMSIQIATDLVWEPLRIHRGDDRVNRDVGTVIHEKRADYKTKGVPYSSGGGATDRKSTERLLGGLEEAGAIVIYGGARRTGVSLTRAGNDLIRYVTAHTMICEAWPMLHRLYRISRAMGKRGRVAETLLGDFAYCNENARVRMSDVECSMAGAAAMGWVDNGWDCNSCVGYFLTPAGKSALASPSAPPMPTDLPEYESKYSDLHQRLYMAAWNHRYRWKVEPGMAVYIPLGAGSWPDPPKGFPPLNARASQSDAQNEQQATIPAATQIAPARQSSPLRGSGCPSLPTLQLPARLCGARCDVGNER